MGNDPVQKQPELYSILERMQTEVSKMEDTSDSIFGKLCAIKDTREPSPEMKEGIGTTANDLVSQFYEVIDRMRKINNSLYDSRENLINIVG